MHREQFWKINAIPAMASVRQTERGGRGQGIHAAAWRWLTRREVEMGAGRRLPGVGKKGEDGGRGWTGDEGLMHLWSLLSRPLRPGGPLLLTCALHVRV